MEGIENWLFIEFQTTLHTSEVQSQKKKKISSIVQGGSGVRHGSRSRRRGRGAGLSRGGWLSRAGGRKGFFCLLVAGDIKVKVQAQVGIINPPLESKPSRSPLSGGFIPQTRYRSVPLNNQSFLPLKVPSQPMEHIGQTFNRAHSFGSFAMGSV